MNKARVSKSGEKHGAVLVITLLMIVVLAVATVAFMQNTSTDRQTARSIGSHYRAQLAAQAGAAAAEALVVDLVRRYPDSATVWQNIGGGTNGAAGTNNEATVLYVRAQSANTNLGARPAQFGGEVSLLAWPLLSRTNATNSTLLSTNAVSLDSVSSTLPFATNNPNVVNLNATNSSRPRPFVGRRSATNAGTPVTAAQWVYLGANPGPTNANNPAIARYAFWVEDESFKVNVNVATNGVRGASSLGLSPAELRLDGAWGSSTNTALRGANAGTVVTARNGLSGSNFPTALTAALPAGLTNTNATDELKFLTTPHSAGLDLSRGGFKRFNINTVTTGPARISLNRVIAAITNSNSVPNFGQRFYRLTNTVEGINATNAVTSEHANIYLQKIAVNILDYIDDDDIPTIVSSAEGFPIHPQGQAPEYGIEAEGGGNSGPPVLYTNATEFVPLAAVGVENVPRLQEYVIHGRILDMSPYGLPNSQTNDPPGASFSVTIDHYLEFWNPGTRDFVVGSGSGEFIKLYSIPPFDLNGVEHELTDPERIVRIDLPEGFTFPAGAVTVITTDPEPNTDLTQNRPVTTLPISEGARAFTGTTRAFSTSDTTGWDPNFANTYQLKFQGRQSEGLGSSLTDYGMVMLLGSSQGFLDSSIGLPIAGSGNVFSLDWNRPEKRDTPNQYFVRGGSLRGNSTSGSGPTSTEGDPRTLNEQLSMRIYVSDDESNFEQTRFFTTLTDTNVPGNNSSIALPNANFVRSTNWVDFSSVNPGAANAPLFLRNSAMQSIGELGHITDPARVPGRTGGLTNIIHSRGGGRTLRVGQPELRAVAGTAATARPGWFDGDQTSASRTWTSWRLADIFTTKTNVSIAGLINPNGSLRDNGAALRAAFHGTRFLDSPEGAPTTASRLLATNNINNLVSNVIARMTNVAAAGIPTGSINAFWERGELSELPLFSSTTQLGPSMQVTLDRGREELVRRSIEMITTRGSVFTVYSVGQTLQGTNVTGVARMKQTFQIEPVFQNPTDAVNDAFPVDSGGIQRRFAAPIDYTVRVLQTSHD